MAPEESTVRLYHRLEDGLGKGMATVLVEHFATKQDLADLRAEMRETFATKTELKEAVAELKIAMANLESRLHRDMKNMALALVSTNIVLLGGVVAILR